MIGFWHCKKTPLKRNYNVPWNFIIQVAFSAHLRCMWACSTCSLRQQVLLQTLMTMEILPIVIWGAIYKWCHQFFQILWPLSSLSWVIKGWWHWFGSVVYVRLFWGLRRPRSWWKYKQMAVDNTFYQFRWHHQLLSSLLFPTPQYVEFKFRWRFCVHQYNPWNIFI